MKAVMSKKLRAILDDPELRKELQKALAGQESIYKIEPAKMKKREDTTE